MINYLLKVFIMKSFFHLILFFGMLSAIIPESIAQEGTENSEQPTKNQKNIVQPNPANYLVFVNRSHTLSPQKIRELIKENNYYIPTKKLLKDFGFKRPTYHPSYNINYKLRIKTSPPGLFKTVKRGN